MHKLIYISLAFLSFSAGADESKPIKTIVEYHSINSSIGQLRFELKIIDDSDRPVYQEIHVENLHGKTIQTIPVESWLPNPGFYFMDLNDDGHTDLLFYNTYAGHGGSASTGADVFLFVPKLEKFVKSETLTSRGNISKLKAKGCVNVNYKSSNTGYTDEEWCFILKTGHWKMVKSTINEPSAE